VREAVASTIPGLLGYFDSAYGDSTRLTSGEFVVESAEGVQQGDPLGPLLFCLAINPLLRDIQSEFVSGYSKTLGLVGRWKWSRRKSENSNEMQEPVASNSTTTSVRLLGYHRLTAHSG
jgi:hypothetical protein